MLGATEAHTDQVAPCCWGLAINEAFTSMKNCKVVDEVHVTSLRLNFHLGGLGDCLDGIQRFDLAECQGWKMLRSGMGVIPKESGSAKVHDKFRVLVEDYRTALEARPVRSVSFRLAR